MLQLDIRKGQVPLTGETEEYVRERAGRLDNFFGSILTCRVTIEAPVGHHQKGGPYGVNIDLDVPGKVINVNHRQADDLHVAIRKAFDAAERRLEDHARIQRGQTKVHEPVLRPGTVVRVFADDGYGFIDDANGAEVYFHRNALAGLPFGPGLVGQHVRFSDEIGDRGPQAVVVQPS